MLFKSSFLLVLQLAVCDDGNRINKPYSSLPVPLDFPNRNDRAEQCYVRIEDMDIVETVSMYCEIAHAFLNEHISEYNSKKQLQDGVEVSSWGDDFATEKVGASPISQYDYAGNNVKNWKLVTILDPITQMRIYVTRKADCHVIMYNRQAMSNYRVNCEKLLSYVNESSNGFETIHRTHFCSLLAVAIFTLFSL